MIDHIVITVLEKMKNTIVLMMFQVDWKLAIFNVMKASIWEMDQIKNYSL